MCASRVCGGMHNTKNLFFYDWKSYHIEQQVNFIFI